MTKIRLHIARLIFCLPWICLPLLSQHIKEIRGTVVSEEDQSVIVGATVMIPHTTIGTSTDAEGKFRLKNIPEDRRTIVVSAVGYKPSTVELREDWSEEITISLEPSLVQTQTVVVTANKRQQSLEEIPVSMSIVDARHLEQRNITAVDDALRYVPGVNFQQSQINIRASSGYSRGVGSRVMMLVDGVPLLAGDTGEITFESIPVLQIERIEVVKGAGSALYGSGALGGVVNVLTKDPTEQTSISWKTYGGFYDEPTFDQWQWSDKTRFQNGQSIGLSTTVDQLGITASLQRHSDDGYREQDWLRKYNGFVKLRYDLSPYQSVTVSSNLYQHYRGDFLWWKDLKNALRPADAQRNVMVTSLRFNNSILFKHFVSDNFYYDVKAVHFRGNWYRDSLNNTRLDHSVSDAMVVDVQGNFTMDERNMLTFGIIGNAERVRANIFGIHDGSGAALYLQEEYKFSSDLSATFGLRYDMQRVVGLATNRQTSPKAGIRYTFSEGQTLRASVGRGFRAPSIGELYTSTSNTGSAAIVIPSVNLKPEHSWTYEISGSNVINENISVETALFHSTYRDLIEANVQADTALKAVTVNFRNLTQAKIQGFEFSVLTNHFDNSFSVDGHYNYNWAVDATTNDFLRFRPRHIASMNVEFRDESFIAAADYRFVSRIEAIDDKLVDLAPVKNGGERVPIHIVDLRTVFTLTEFDFPIRLSLQVNNLLAYNYNELIGNVSPPRHFVLSFEGIVR